jgi:proteasome lid subunit RPN8/RPN11
MNRLPAAARDALVAHARGYGRDRLESGGFLIADRSAHVVVVACAGATGISRGRCLFKISGEAVDCLFSWCEARDLTIAAMFHSHERTAFLSVTDRQLGLNVRGLTSVVLPTFADPPLEPGTWGWFNFDGSDWVFEDPWSLSATEIQTITFDQDGIRE